MFENLYLATRAFWFLSSGIEFLLSAELLQILRSTLFNELRAREGELQEASFGSMA